ncbi:Coprogen oxidas domain containing protein [Asbolus verrucosus]|uniref:coproporphyrinogen oxidase n=1 Tax=Asbolus verrucosus TaxID=1661398 RepID=A0A482VSK2_ASBVE|nr:Coprogen oxidas domain containing protein [Asbolus verrucosus]
MALPITPPKKLEETPDNIRTRVELMVMRVQAQVCKALEKEDDCSTFVVDRWHNDKTTGGVNCILQNGKVFETAAINIFVSSGNSTETELPFFSAGISGVIHPKNPMIPSINFNYQYIEVKGDNRVQWWFGGSTDLTPNYLNTADAVHFHSTLKKVCDKHDMSYYPKFKKWCDDYFNIPHRGERLGIGGIYFDDLKTPNQDACFKFAADCADAVIPSYIPLVQRHKHATYTQAERNWQLHRRGRYVEFKLIYDRSSKFGSGARSGDILMTLPLVARWEYMYQINATSPEGELLAVLRKPKDWIEECSCSDHLKE